MAAFIVEVIQRMAQKRSRLVMTSGGVEPVLEHREAGDDGTSRGDSGRRDRTQWAESEA
jgi:hypothetical protein